MSRIVFDFPIGVACFWGLFGAHSSPRTKDGPPPPCKRAAGTKQEYLDEPKKPCIMNSKLFAPLGGRLCIVKDDRESRPVCPLSESPAWWEGAVRQRRKMARLPRFLFYRGNRAGERVVYRPFSPRRGAPVTASAGLFFASDGGPRAQAPGRTRWYRGFPPLAAGAVLFVFRQIVLKRRLWERGSPA